MEICCCCCRGQSMFHVLMLTSGCVQMRDEEEGELNQIAATHNERLNVLSSWVKTRVSGQAPHPKNEKKIYKTIKTLRFYLRLQHACLMSAILHAGWCHKSFTFLLVRWKISHRSRGHRRRWEKRWWGCLLILLLFTDKNYEEFPSFGPLSVLIYSRRHADGKGKKNFCPSHSLFMLLDLSLLLFPLQKKILVLQWFRFFIRSSTKRDSFGSRKTFFILFRGEKKLSSLALNNSLKSRFIGHHLCWKQNHHQFNRVSNADSWTNPFWSHVFMLIESSCCNLGWQSFTF